MSRVQYTQTRTSAGISIWCFNDCMNIGEAIRLAREGHPCFRGNYIYSDAVLSSGFTENEVESLFKTKPISKRRISTFRRNSLLYRKRLGAISHAERRKKNVDEYKKVEILRRKGLKRSAIAQELDLSVQRVRYLIQTFSKEGGRNGKNF